MNLLTLRRSMTEFGQVVWRNRLMSLATVLAMAMVFFLTALIFSVNNSSERIIQRVEDKVDIGVFFQKKLPQFQIDAFLTELNRLQEDGKIKSYQYFSQEYALQEMKKKFPEKVRFLERYQFENPLQASVEIVPGEWSPDELFHFLQQPNFRTVIDLQFLERYEEKKVEVNRILKLLAFFRRGGFFLVLLFLGVSAALVGFFVSSTLQQKKREIFIMRLVGAAHSSIRLPFLLEGMALALLAYLFSFFLFAIFLDLIAPGIVNFFTSSRDKVFMGELLFDTQKDFLDGLWWGILLVLFTSGIISFLMVERFLRKRHLLANE